MTGNMSYREYFEVEERVDTVTTFLEQIDPLDSPQEYGVPHTSWRPNQLDALQFVSDTIRQEKTGSKVFLQLPTGSGKSAIPTALGQNNRVLVLVQSLALLDQYRDRYGFTVVKGMQEYECVLPDRVAAYKAKTGVAPRVSQCTLDKMTDCPVYDKCPYIVARQKALAAKRMACTYPFAMLSRAVQSRAGIAVWDEAHCAADVIMQLSEVRFSERFRSKFNLAPFPLMGYQDIMTRTVRSKIIQWLDDGIRTLSSPPSTLMEDELSEWKGAAAKLNYAMQTLSDLNIDYFMICRADLEEENVISYGRWVQRKTPAISFRPLSASVIANRLFANKVSTVLMSATIGDPKPLANELGTGAFLFKDYPHPVPLEYRPVYDLEVPRMTWDALQKTPALYKVQANAVARFLHQYPSDWRGIILCSSYDKVNRLKAGLMEVEDLSDRIFTPPRGEEGLSKRIQSFLNDKRKGLLVVDTMQGWGHGLDLAGDLARIAIVASVPFGNHADPFEMARRSYSSASQAYAWWSSYMNVPQACGRVSRGELDDTDDFVLNVAALADGSATSPSAFRYYPSWFTNSILKF